MRQLPVPERRSLRTIGTIYGIPFSLLFFFSPLSPSCLVTGPLFCFLHLCTLVWACFIVQQIRVRPRRRLVAKHGTGKGKENNKTEKEREGMYTAQRAKCVSVMILVLAPVSPERSLCSHVLSGAWNSGNHGSIDSLCFVSSTCRYRYKWCNNGSLWLIARDGVAGMRLTQSEFYRYIRRPIHSSCLDRCGREEDVAGVRPPVTAQKMKKS